MGNPLVVPFSAAFAVPWIASNIATAIHAHTLPVIALPV
jgi:hypothetical protein